MSSDSWRPEFSTSGPKPDAVPQPSDEDVVRALVEIQKASNGSGPTADSPVVEVRPWSDLPVSGRWLALVTTIVVSAAFVYVAQRRLSSFVHLVQKKTPASHGTVRRVNSPIQAEAEGLLNRLGTGDAEAGDQVLAQSAEWTGRTHRTPNSEQMITAALNSTDLHVRAAAVQAQLALDGVPQNEAGIEQMKQVVGNPQQRDWALWTLGALANRGVDPDRIAQIIETYLGDPDARVRATAVDALSLVATEETIAMLLDRFRNDSSPMVQERAACDLAEAGMYTHAQRMIAASNLVGWVDDSLLSAQQRAWTVQALGDISGKRLGNDASAWRDWYVNAQ